MTQITHLVAANDNSTSGVAEAQVAFKSLVTLLARAELRAQSRSAANTNAAPLEEAQK